MTAFLAFPTVTEALPIMPLASAFVADDALSLPQ